MLFLLLLLLLWRRFFIIFIFFRLLPPPLSDQSEEGMAFTVYKYMEILNEIYENFVVNCILIYPKFLYFIFFFFRFLLLLPNEIVECCNVTDTLRPLRFAFHTQPARAEFEPLTFLISLDSDSDSVSLFRFLFLLLPPPPSVLPLLLFRLCLPVPLPLPLANIRHVLL